MVTNERAIQIVQITDCHLTREAGGELLGVNTRDSLDAVLALIKTNHPSPDIVLASGDIAQDGSVAAYRCFKEKTAFFDCPVYWFAGNHDNLEKMAQVTKGSDVLTKQVRVGNWQLLLLDSSVAGQVFGKISPAELELLDRVLDAASDQHCLLGLHHHSIDIQCQWLDAIGLHNRDQLFEIIEQYDNIRAIVCGHIHQELDQTSNGIRYLAAPSTCVQFEPKTKAFSVANQAPGYRWLQLYPNGDIGTGVNRLDNFNYEVDASSEGY